jgi:AAHS family 3-hydroxyphenylpropionic acid transporter
MPLGGALVALLSQVLPAGSSWRILFLVGGLLPLALAFVLHRVLPETRGGASAQVSAMPVREALFGGQRTSPTLLLWVTFLPTLLSLYLLLNWLPMLMVQKGFSKAVAPLAVLVFNSPSVVGTLIIGTLVDRFGARRIIVPSFLLLAITLYVLSSASGFATVLLLLGITGFLLLSANYALYGIAAQQYPLAGRGTGSGAAVAVGRLGSILGPLLAGVLLSGGTDADGVIARLIPGALIAALAVLLLRRPPADAA